MPKTYNELYIYARKKLRDMDVSAAGLEARLIVSCAAEKSKNSLLADMNLYTSETIEKRVYDMVERRQQGEPVAYITGEWEFYGLPMVVNPDVLIPRIDTEVLAESAVNALHGRKMDARIIDLCTGSGCIGCAIAKALPATTVVLGDINPKALSVAKQNVQKNKLNPRVSCIEIDALQAPPMMLGSFDLFVCNPPYIPTQELDGLDKSVRDYEPLDALDGGEDGLKFYRRIIDTWRGIVRVGGLMMFEVGAGQAQDVMMLMRVAGLKNVGTVKDTLDIDRVVYGNV